MFDDLYLRPVLTGWKNARQDYVLTCTLVCYLTWIGMVTLLGMFASYTPTCMKGAHQ